MRIYLDNSCFHRQLDDQKNLVTNIEEMAKVFIQLKISNGDYELVWSDILDYEDSKNLYKDMYNHISKWKAISKIIVPSNDIVVNKAERYKLLGIKVNDSIHIASSVIGKCDYFITVDNDLLNKSKFISDIKIISPYHFIFTTLNNESFDYTKWKEEIFEDETLESLGRKAYDFCISEEKEA